MHCNAISHAFCHTRKHPVDPQKGVADLWLYQLATMHLQMHVHTGIKILLPRSYRRRIAMG